MHVRLIKSIALFVLIVVALLAAPILFIDRDTRPPTLPTEGLPWQIEVLPDGNTRVFGLMPGSSTLQDAHDRFGPDAQVALIVAPGEPGSVEAFYESVTVGVVTGKVILTLETSPAQREAMLKRALKADFMESTTRKVELADVDLQDMHQAKMIAIAFIPSANLTEDIILQRFGTPVERIRAGDQVEHFLYPDRGLDLRLDTKGKEVLQYVTPRDFARLRDPLHAATKQRG